MFATVIAAIMIRDPTMKPCAQDSRMRPSGVEGLPISSPCAFCAIAKAREPSPVNQSTIVERVVHSGIRFRIMTYPAALPVTIGAAVSLTKKSSLVLNAVVKVDEDVQWLRNSKDQRQQEGSLINRDAETVPLATRAKRRSCGVKVSEARKSGMIS